MKGLFYTVLLSSFFFVGCKQSPRGVDFFRIQNEQLSLKTVGFQNSLNPTLGADIILSPKITETDLSFHLPFNVDMEQELILTYTLISTGAFVQYKDDKGTWQNGGFDRTPISFLSSSSKIISREIRVVRYDDVKKQNFYRNYTLNASRYFKLFIESELAENTQTDKEYAILNAVFKDSVGRDIGVNAGTWNKTLISAKNMSISEPYYDATLGKYQIKVYPVFPGSQTIDFKLGAFLSPYGGVSNAVSLTFQYKTPTIYLSKSGSSGNSGTSPSAAFNSWESVMSLIKTNYTKDETVSVLVAASSTPYIVNLNSSEINSNMPNLRIVGGYNTSFSSYSGSPWESSSRTTFESSSSLDGISELNPQSVFKITGDIEKDSVFMINLEINAPNVKNNAAVFVDAKAQPSFINVMFNANEGQQYTAALIAKNESQIFAKNSRFFGKTTGTGNSSGIRLDSATLDISEKSVVSGGDLTGVDVYGIHAEGSKSIKIEDSIIIAGGSFSGTDTNKETNTYGLYIKRRNISGVGVFKKAWIHAAESSGRALGILVDGDGYFDQLIDSGTIIVEGKVSCAVIINNTRPDEEFYLNNSVLLRKKSTSVEALVEFAKQPSAPVLSSIHPRYLMGNFIYGGGIKYGGDLKVSIYNNLIQADTSESFLAIQASTNDSYIQNNNFWKSESDRVKSVLLRIGTQNPTKIIDSQDSIYINNNTEDGKELKVDVNFAYSNDMEVGKIENDIFNDISYGGYDLSVLRVTRRGGIAFDLPNLSLDRDGNKRTGSFSMGPYERGSGSALTVIYVSPSGNDFYPLGTIRNPFASINKAFYVARSGAKARKNVSEIRVMKGRYQQEKPLTLNANIRILGGYDSSFSTRETTRSAELEWKKTPQAITITGSNISRDFLMDGFTIRNLYGKAMGNTRYTGISVSSNATPTIQNNSIGLVGQETQTSTISGVELFAIDVVGADPLFNNIKIIRHSAVENLGDGSAHTTKTRGIDISGDSSNVIISNSIIEAGDGLEVSGIVASEKGTLKITSTTIVGNSNTDSWPKEVVGINLNNRQTIMEKTIVTGGYAKKFYGIKVGNGIASLRDGRFEFKSGMVYGGFNNKTSFQNGAAINLATIGTGTKFTTSGSLIYGGLSSVKDKKIIAVEISYLTGNAQFIGNTIYGGQTVRSSSSQNAAFIVKNGSPSLVNNIIIIGESVSSGSQFARGYYNVSGGAPKKLRNNIFIGVANKMAPYVANSLVYNNAPEIKTVLAGSDLETKEYNGNRVRYESSISELKTYFKLGSSNLESLRMTNLQNGLLKPTGTGSNPEIATFIKSGGYDFPNPFSLNVEGEQRKDPPSVGAY